MQDIFFSVDRSVRAWAGRLRTNERYSEADCTRIEMGIKMMLTVARAKKQLLVPLTALPGGVVYYVSLVRNERDVKIVQLRVEINENGVFHHTRAVEVSDGMKAAYPHIRFRTEQSDMTDNRLVFWDVFSKEWEVAYQAISLSNPQHAISGRMELGYSTGDDAWTQAPDPATVSLYRPAFATRVELTLREICGGAPSMMVRHSNNNQHFIALIRNGSAINAVDVRVFYYPVHHFGDVEILERMVVFSPNMAQVFPGVQFGSVRLTDAEKHRLMQEPVLRFYQAKNDAYFRQHYHGPRLTALAMCLHPRLRGASHIGALDQEMLMLIARMTI